MSYNKDMGLAHEQEVPKREEAKEPWTIRRLFPFAGATSAIAKTFTNPFDVLLGFLIVVVSVAELAGRHVSWFLWVLTVLILLVDLAERHKKEQKPEEKPKS